jgi:uncharacterized protein (TIGR03086 family)
MDVNTLYHRSVESFADRVNAVQEEQWGDPTPCSEWTVRDLTNHVTAENLWTAPLLEGATIEEVGDRFDGDVLGEDPIRSALTAARAAITSMAEQLPVGGTVHLSFGETPKEEYAMQLAADNLVHGWDLAAATGGDTRMDPRMRLVAGRLFTDADRGGNQPVAMVNEAFAAQMYGGLDRALGRRIAIGSDREVIGVVSDTAGWTLGEPARPMMFVPLAQVEERVVRTAHAFFPPRWIVRARDVNTARRELAAVVREIDPTQPFIEIQSLDAMLLNSVGMQRFYLIVLSAFALFAVLLAAVGIYAAYSYAMASRTAEIGVRLALGASPGAIVRSIMWRALMRGAIAIAVGLAGAAATTRVLDSVLFNIRSSDPWTYVAVAVVLLGAVGLATLIPAARAVKMDPLAALRR